MEIYATCPPGGTLTAVAARWAEEAGLRGLLIFTDNDSPDPWALAQHVVERTTALVPLVAVQPLYMHPYTVARKVSTIGSMYGREVDLNFVTGGYRPHLRALGCSLEHDERYERLAEYGAVVADLLCGNRSTYEGRFYRGDRAVLHPPLPDGLSWRTFVAGSSDAAAEVASALGAVRLTYPRSPAEYGEVPTSLAETGIRVGVIARETSAEAWRLARQRYPDDPFADGVHEDAARVMDARWHSGLWQASGRANGLDSVYWLHPFRVTFEFCPYLVGSYAEVGELLGYYLRAGVSTLILQAPREEDDLAHAMIAVRRAERVAARSGQAPLSG